MANHIYPTALDAMLSAFLAGDPPGGIADIFVCGVGAGYVYNDSHELVADLAGNITAPAVQITNPGYVNGAVGGDDLTPAWEGLAPGVTINAIVVFASFASGDHLLMYADSNPSLSLPYVASGANVNVRWNPNGIFKI